MEAQVITGLARVASWRRLERWLHGEAATGGTFERVAGSRRSLSMANTNVVPDGEREGQRQAFRGPFKAPHKKVDLNLLRGAVRRDWES
jgi:hypothetical protein